MGSFSKDRLEKTLKVLVSDVILTKLTNSNLSLTTVTGVTLSNDKSHLKVFVTFEGNKKNSLEALNASKGFIKREISLLDGLRKVPQLVFEIDKSYEEGQRIEELLQKIKAENK